MLAKAANNLTPEPKNSKLLKRLVYNGWIIKIPCGIEPKKKTTTRTHEGKYRKSALLRRSSGGTNGGTNYIY